MSYSEFEVRKLTRITGPIHTSFNDFRIPMEEDFIKPATKSPRQRTPLPMLGAETISGSTLVSGPSIVLEVQERGVMPPLGT